jgi:hypothetical protein
MKLHEDCIIVQLISCRNLTARVRIQPQVRSCGICGDQNATGVGFLQVLISHFNYHSTKSSVSVICHVRLVGLQ